MRSYPNNKIEMGLRMHDLEDRSTLHVGLNHDSMTIMMYRYGEQTGMDGGGIRLTYEETEELCDHLLHMLHGPAYPKVPLHQHLDELDEIDATLGVERKAPE